MKSIDLAVVIVSFQVREHVRRCLASLLDLTSALQLQIIVVDNASSDGSAELIRSQFPSVQLICNPQNLGFARANNQGLALARGRYWMLLNPDTEIKNEAPTALDFLVSFMDAHPRAGACGPRLIYPDGTHQHSAFRFPSLAQVYFDLFPAHWRLMESRLNGRYPRQLYDAGKPFAIDHPLGAALLVRAQAAQEVGLLDEDYFIYVEEVDWCWRIKRAGWELWCVPNAVVLHHEARSTRQFRESMFVELWKARLTFYRKHFSKSYNFAVRQLVRLGMARAKSNAARAFQRGELPESEIQRRLEAYTRVETLARDGTGG